MTRKILENKPLIEAIFELKWSLQQVSSGPSIDPHYKLLIGRMYDRLSNEYPFPERLPTATMPDEIAGYVVQHRFRKGKDEWPLVQIGPGIVTVNDTEKYTWEDFKKRIDKVLAVLFKVYPDAENNLKIDSLLLRYIDAINFDFTRHNGLNFLKSQMKTSISLYPRLFEDTGVNEIPSEFDLKFSFNSAKPKGVIHLRFVRGKKKKGDALIWETMVQSVGKDAPKAKKAITSWVKEAHNLTDDWFFKIIEGDLQGRFE